MAGLIRGRGARGAQAGYGAAVRLMWETSHPLSFAVAGYAIAASIMPNLVLIAAGHLVGSIPAASADGPGSAAGLPPRPAEDHLARTEVRARRGAGA